MKISNLTLNNFRSIEALSVDFPSFYTAISGKNNSGKSNLLRALKILFEPERRFRYKDDDINFPQHFPVWKEKNSVEPIRFSLTLQVDRLRDSAIFKLADEFFKIG